MRSCPHRQFPWITWLGSLSYNVEIARGVEEDCSHAVLFFSYVFIFRRLSFAGGFANRPVTKVINGYRRRFTITQWRESYISLKLVAN